MDAAINSEINQLNLEAIQDEQAQADFNDSLKPEELEPLPREPDQEVLQALNAVFGMAAGSLAPNWNIQPEEIEIVSQATEVVLDKYMPGVKDSIGCEFALVLAVGGIVLPRLSIPRYENEQKSIEDKENSQSQGEINNPVKDDGLGDLRAMQESEVVNGG